MSPHIKPIVFSYFPYQKAQWKLSPTVTPAAHPLKRLEGECMEVFSRLPFISNCKLIVFAIVFYICGQSLRFCRTLSFIKLSSTNVWKSFIKHRSPFILTFICCSAISLPLCHIWGLSKWNSNSLSIYNHPHNIITPPTSIDLFLIFWNPSIDTNFYTLVWGVKNCV